MSPKQTELRKAVSALYAQVPFEVAKDVDRIVTDANGEMKALNVLLLNACKSALKALSDVANINGESRAGWAHKEIEEVQVAIDAAEKLT